MAAEPEKTTTTSMKAGCWAGMKRVGRPQKSRRTRINEKHTTELNKHTTQRWCWRLEREPEDVATASSESHGQWFVKVKVAEKQEDRRL
ncbi:hypothetical protein TIFTF001_043403 [Ficus carica]|uniref:Uncharacterized protein n=1 Tax=Ficus carica TaxID=3494 RepID=A0AA88CL65_FICCA|nr:hypothetical protein TIFTF001_043403 [Ficus carica]